MEDISQGTPTPGGLFRLPVSLRTRLIAANVLITAVAIAALGYYVYYRGQQSTAFLTNELDSSVRQKAVDTLTVASTTQTNTLNSIFTSIRKDITGIGVSTNMLLSREDQLGKSAYWDAAQSLARLPSGSWDNPSHSEPASVFMPARVELTAPLTKELNTLKQLDFTVPAILQADSDVVAIYFGGTSGETIYYPNVDLANLVPPDFDVTQRPWYLAAAPAQNPGRIAIWSAPYLDAAQHGLVVTNSYPVFDATQGFRGVVAMDIQLNRMSYIVSSIRVGVTGYGFVVDDHGRLIALPDAGYKDLGLTPQTAPLGEPLDQGKLGESVPPEFLGVLSKMKAGQAGLETVSMKGQERYVIYRPIPDIGYDLAIMVPAEEMLTGAAATKQQISMAATNTQQISFVLVAIILGFALLSTLGIGNTLISPLVSLTATAEEIASGNLNARAGVRGRDEIATLAQALNTMTSRLRESIQSLERRVRDRTAALEVASLNAAKRAAQFEAITQVTRAISSIRNMDELMPLVAAVISQYFDFYHVGIFLNDENNQYAWLIAANSEGGRNMLQRHHSLRIGEQGIVGYVAAHGESRVARSVGADAVFFDNPDLPGTKSEAALPLRRGAQVAGVLDVQSTKEDAFSDEDLSILAILADQVSLAMENTRLLERTRSSLMEAETLYRQYVQQAWSRLPKQDRVTSYRYTPRGAAAIQTSVELGSAKNSPASAEVSTSSPPLVMPIKLRGETIGNLTVQAPGAGWTQDQIDLVRAIAERVAFSAENARLFDETSRRAERERLVTHITSRIRSTNDPDEMIRTALEELRNALGATDIQIIPQIVPPFGRTQDETSGPAAQEPGPEMLRGNGANR
jgi:GAF domain-containing protein/HAMP domain-containing protein